VLKKKKPSFASFLFSQNKILQKNTLKNIHHNCLQHERMLQMYLLSYFEHHQIWLNICMDDCHLHNNTKIGGKNKQTNSELKTPEISTTSIYYKYDICGCRN
jgi:hypothetical protein